MSPIRLAAVVVMLLGTALPTMAQVRQAEYRIHHRGDLWETVKDDGTIGAPSPTNRFDFTPSMDWPGGPAKLPNKDEQRSYCVGSGLWIGGKKGAQLFFTENGPFTFVDAGTFEKISEVSNFVGSSAYNPAEAEERITAEFTTTEGVRVKRVSRSWSFPGLNTFLLLEYAITNQSGGALTDVYIGFPYLLRPSYQDFVAHNGWGDDANRDDDYAVYDSANALMYSYDGTPNFSIPTDVGNYWALANEMRTPGYAGVALGYADPASDGRTQPAHVLGAQLLGNERFFTLVSNTRENMYAILSGADRSLQWPRDSVCVPFMLMSCGPYTMQAGSTVRIVVVHAVNGLPLRTAIQGLSVQPQLPAGLDSLRASVSRARALIARNYAPDNIPPPSPETEVIPVPSSKAISITWPPLETTWTNPLTGRSDVRAYRLYRGERSFPGPFTLLKTINPKSLVDRGLYFDQALGKWKYLDVSINLGVGYYYAVTTVDSAGREGGFTNRNESSVRAAAPPAENTDAVTVFPNPFREVSGFPTRGDENSIVWANTPGECTIRIYTSSGELIRTLENKSGTSGQVLWDQLTESRQVIAPGIYFWTLESSVGTARGSLLIIK